jgi:hypothetical protein
MAVELLAAAAGRGWLPADPEVPAGHRNVAGDLLDVPQHGQPAPHLTVQ